MRNIILFLVVLFLLGGGLLYFNNSQKQPSSTPTYPLSSQAENSIKPEESTASAQNPQGYKGKLLAGNSTSPFLEFTKTDYETALSENKIILLDFYANW